LTLYIDASAFVKLVLLEDETGPLQRDIDPHAGLLSSEILEVEVVLATRRRSGDVALARQRLANVELFAVGARIRRRASEFAELRALDAIHLATALEAPGLDVFYCYDDRLAKVARAAGLTVRSPGYAPPQGED